MLPHDSLNLHKRVGLMESLTEVTVVEDGGGGSFGGGPDIFKVYRFLWLVSSPLRCEFRSQLEKRTTLFSCSLTKLIKS